MTDATWKKHPTSRNFNTAANWSPATVPDGTALFGTSKITHLFLFATTGINGLTFNKDALHYKFDIPNPQQLTVGTGGIVIKGGSASFTNNGGFVFQGTTGAVSSAGKAHILNTGSLQFLTDSSAGRAHISNSSTVFFFSNSTAGNATITAAAFSATSFLDNSDGADARLIAQANSVINFGTSSGPAGNHKISVGSIAGAGTFQLGQDVLTVGSNNRSTTVSGLIRDGGPTGGTDAELVKVGTGTLKLTHANNTYSLATILDAGTFDVAALGAAGPGLIVFDSFISGTHSTLKIENAALSTHVFGNPIFNFAAGDKIDLHGLKFVTGAKATLSGTTLTVKSGHVTDTLTLQSPDPGTFKAVSDHHGGTKVVLVVPQAKPVAQATVSDKQVSDHQGDEHHASLFADNFEFTYLAVFINLDRSWNAWVPSRS